MQLFKCSQCFYYSDKKTNVTRHEFKIHNINISFNNNLHKFQCEKCTKILSSNQSLKYHIEICKGVKNSLQCPICKELFNNRTSKLRHLKNCTTDVISLECLNEINRDNISNTKLFECEKCTKILANNKSLKYHSNICTGVKNSLECYKCYKIFNTSSAKCKHLKICKEENTNNIELLKDTNLELSKDSNLEKKYIKQKIPQSVRITVWDTYIGRSIGEKLCNICNTNKISQFNFHCGHVIAEKNGGKTSINNLRPICKSCNSSMRTMNLDDFKLKFFN